MKNLPVPVLDEDVEEMFTFADTDGDGRLSYQVSTLQIVLLFSQISTVWQIAPGLLASNSAGYT